MLLTLSDLVLEGEVGAVILEEVGVATHPVGVVIPEATRVDLDTTREAVVGKILQ